MTRKHDAALLHRPGSPLSVDKRETPEPGPDEILIEVKAVALNPVDYYQRDFGMPPVPSYPAVLGSDVAGLVTKVGSSLSEAPVSQSRVIAFASSFYEGGSPDYGAFQKYVLARPEGVIPLPDEFSYEEGALFPLAVLTALSGWTTMGITLGTQFTPEDKQAVLIWGGASSVGTFAVQSARAMGYTVYATASPKHHEYLKGLGASAVFDYNSSDVVSQIIDRARRDSVTLRTANCVVDGSLQPTLEVLKATKGAGKAMIAHTPALPANAPSVEGVEVRFNQPPQNPEERRAHIHECFHVWLQNGLKSGEVVPSPPLRVEAEGLEGLDKALDTLKAGVSGTKLIVKA